MKYMLDTNICIRLIKRKPTGLIRKLTEHDAAEFCISSITYAELMHGVEKSAYRDQNFLALMLTLSSITILPFDTKAAEVYGKVRSSLERNGMQIGPMDTLIASHALSRGLTVITNNTGEFKRVTGLAVEDWVN